MSTTVLTVRVKMAPPAGLSPNARSGWGKRYRLGQDAKAAGYVATIDALNREGIWTIWETMPLLVDITIGLRKRGKTLDMDNAIGSCKQILDGIAQALNEDDRRFVIRSCTQVRDPDGLGYTMVTISQEVTT